MKVQCGALLRCRDIARLYYDAALCSVFMAPQSICRLKWAYESAMQCDMAAVRRPLDGSQRLKVFNAYDVRKCLEIAMNKNSLAFKSLCALKAANKKLNLGVVRTVAACERVDLASLRSAN